MTDEILNVSEEQMEIIRLGDQRLYERCAAITDEPRHELEAIAAVLAGHLTRLNATGIAAPQVAIMKRVIAFQLPRSRMPENCALEPFNLTVMFNPVVEVTDDQDVLMWEKCLSIPGFYGEVIRKRAIRLHFEDIDRGRHQIDFRGYPASVIQHEIDHLDGILYLDRLSDRKRFGFCKEMVGHDDLYPYTPTEFEHGIEIRQA